MDEPRWRIINQNADGESTIVGPDHNERKGISQVICQVFGGAGGSTEEDHLIAELIRSAPETFAELQKLEKLVKKL